MYKFKEQAKTRDMGMDMEKWESGSVVFKAGGLNKITWQVRKAREEKVSEERVRDMFI